MAKRAEHDRKSSVQAWLALTGRDSITKTHTYLQMPSTRDTYREKLEKIKAIAKRYSDVKYNFTFQEDSGFHGGVLTVNPEDDLKDIERAFKGRSKIHEEQ